MFYKLLIACSLTFKSKLTVTGSGKTSPPPEKNAPNLSPRVRVPTKKTDVKFLLNLLNSNVFQSHGLQRKIKGNVSFFQLIECMFYQNLVYPEYAEYIMRMYNPSGKYFINDLFWNRSFCWNLNAGLN